MPCELYFIRHGETDWNRLGKYQGHRDVPLNSRGLSQAESLARDPDLVMPDFLFVSSLSRALKTAEIVYPNFPFGKRFIHDDLREAGSIEAARYLLEKAGSSKEPDYSEMLQNGESADAFLKRVESVFDWIRVKCEGKVGVIVAHGGVLAAHEILKRRTPFIAENCSLLKINS